MYQLRRISYLLCLVCLFDLCYAMTHSVFIYKPFGLVTTITSTTLIWESYVENSDKQKQYAVHAGKYATEDGDGNYATFVCRGRKDGIYAVGYTKLESGRVICLASMHDNVIRHPSFELLINKGLSGKISWQTWNKYTSTPVGAVSVSNMNSDENFSIARHKIRTFDGSSEQQHHHHHHNVHGNDFVVGSLDKTRRLQGVIVAAVNETNLQEFDDGEILTETEPVRYEMKKIKYSSIKTKITRNTTLLGSTVLSNSDEGTNSVETVITYEYDRVVHWTSPDAISRGLPTTVFEDDKSKMSTIIEWGLKKVEKVFETKTINTILQPGTAMNVTMIGEYTTTDAPYKAQLITYYTDNSTMSRQVDAYSLKKDMKDIKIEYSPVYFIHNNSLVPTTTTTTTTTTSTTEPTTTTKEPAPLPETPKYDVTDNEIIPESQENTERIVKLENVPQNLSNPSSTASVNSILVSVMSLPVFYTIVCLYNLI